MMTMVRTAWNRTTRFPVAGGHCAVAFEAVDAVLDGVAQSVELRVELGWAPAFGTFGFAVGVLVLLARDARFDPSGARIPSVGSAGVSLVGQHQHRSCPRPTDPATADPNATQDRDELRAVTTMPRGPLAPRELSDLKFLLGRRTRYRRPLQLSITATP